MVFHAPYWKLYTSTLAQEFIIPTPKASGEDKKRTKCYVYDFFL
jgi:hypothetical protein